MSSSGEILDLLQRLVAFRTDTSEQQQTTWLAQLLERWGAQTRLDEILPGRVNLLATWPGQDAGRSLLFEAHGDTVGGNVPTRLDAAAGLLHGRGTCDTKASIAAMLTAIQRSVATGRRLRATVHFASTCREETGGEGAKALMSSGFRPSMAVVGEPTRLAIIRAHKGAWRVRITTRGVAAHSSDPSRGVNAIYAMRRVLELLEKHYPPLLAAQQNPLLGAPTMSVGTIHGGMAVNVVPDRCMIEVDWRIVPGQDVTALLADLRARLPGVEVEPCEEWYPAFHEPDDSPVLALAQRACLKALGQPAALGGVPWATNAGFFSEAGIPCVIFGPGNIAQAHTASEYVELRQVKQAADVYQQMLLEA